MKWGFERIQVFFDGSKIAPSFLGCIDVTVGMLIYCALY